MSEPQVPIMQPNRKALIRLVAGFALLVLLVSLGNFVFKEVKVRGLINSANELILKDRFDEASLKINQALDVKPRDTKSIYALKEKITSIKNGIYLIENSEEKAKAGDFISAITSLNRISTSERDLNSKAKELVETYKVKAELQFEREFGQVLRRGDFNQAVSLIDSYNRAFPESKKYDELRNTYVAKSIAQIEAKRKAALGKMSKKIDAFQDITWYQSPSSTKYRNANAFHLYFGVSNGSTAGLRLVIQYYSDDWLFIKSAKVNVDGVIYTVGSSEWERDNDSDIWEWIDEPLSDRSLIEAIIKSKSSVIRFEGTQYYDTRTISSTQKRALRDVLDAYDSF
jgi:tetratricopeptide (TPR) repeat protein